MVYGNCFIVKTILHLYLIVMIRYKGGDIMPYTNYITIVCENINDAEDLKRQLMTIRPTDSISTKIRKHGDQVREYINDLGHYKITY